MTFICGTGRSLPFLTKADRRRNRYCCMGSVEDGPKGCTCWEPVYDLEQVPPNLAEGVVSETRTKRCGDCAYRPDSPEREDGRLDDITGVFFCHQGIRRPVAYRHPDGRVREWVDTTDYQPPIHGHRPYKADGTPADICAGWAQEARRAERTGAG